MNVDKLWYQRHPLTWLLLPLSLVYALVVVIRRGCYRLGLFKIHKFSAPVIVVGNITVGGTGKTPLVIWLAEHLSNQGYRPGIVLRGYGGNARNWPQQVTPDSCPEAVGDEAILIARRTACPVFADPDRSAAVKTLLSRTECNIVISDDGLQHHAMNRDIEILVVDGKRGFGNGFLMPAGPLRETMDRLSTVDLVISNGVWQPGIPHMDLEDPSVVALNDPKTVKPLTEFRGQTVDAVAGIGNPQKFFDMLSQYGLEVIPHAFPDHHPYKLQDLDFGSGLPLLMTEKDGVKCSQFPVSNCWMVCVAARPTKPFIEQLDRLVEELKHG